MIRVIATVAGLLLVVGAATAAEPTAVFTGKIVPVRDLNEPPPGPHEPDAVALVTAMGDTHLLIRDDKSRLVFLDKGLHNRPVRLTGEVDPKTRHLRVATVQTVKDGKIFDVDYWCDQCQLAAPEPGKCKCCGSDVVRRERPAK